MARLERLADSAQPSISYVHGFSGLGKSTLVDELARRRQAAGMHVLRIDGRDVEPTERGVLGEFSRHAQGHFTSCEAVAEWLLGFDRVLLIVDDVDALRLLDAWLWRTLLPCLPANVHVVLTGRHAPVPAWFQTSLATTPITLELKPFGEADAVALLCAAGLNLENAIRINRVARGYPLALVLAASCFHFVDETDLQETAALRIAGQLAHKLLSEIMEPTIRQAVECSSLVRVISVPLLHAMLPGIDAERAFEQLRALALVKTARDGVVLHEAIRDAISRNLRVTDPQRFSCYQRRSWTYIMREIRTAPAFEMWRCTADLLFVLENPVIREAFFPSDARHIVIEPARETDTPTIIAIAERHDGADAARAIARWLACAPQAFYVARNQHGKLVGYYVLADAADVSRDLAEADAITKQWLMHLASQPMLAHEQALFLRRWHSADDGEAPGSVQAACWIDIKRSYMAKRPNLRRVYLTLRDVSPYESAATELGFSVLPHAVALDGQTYRTALLDFGPRSVDGWLATLAASQVGAGHHLLDVVARELVVDDRRVALTRREFETMSHLVQNPGAIVSRDELLSGVWGSESEVVSNVVDTTIRSLRKKLAERSAVIETVSGIGYRLRA